MRVTAQMVTRQFNQNIQKNNQAIYSLQQQISSGKKYEKISDNPLEAMKGMSHRSSLAQIEQYQKNVEDGMDRLTAVDDALSNVTDVIQRVRELTVQASNDTLNENDREIVSTEIRSLKEYLGNLANTNFNGRHLFSGMDQNTPSYKDGVLQNVGQSDMNWVIGNGIAVNVNVNAGSVFGFEVDGRNLFETLDGLLKTLDPPPVVETPEVIEQPDTGMNMTLNRFWQSMKELSEQPDSMEIRASVIQNGQAVTEKLAKTTTDIKQAETDLKNQLFGKINELNSTTNGVAELNQQIALKTMSGSKPNDLLDQRDLLLDKLSKLVDLEVIPNQNGMVNLFVGGTTLVNGINAGMFTVSPDLTATMIDGNPVVLEGYEVKGLLDSLREDIPLLQDNLNLLATAIADQMNSVHASDGVTDLNGSSEKLLFFVDKYNPDMPPKDASRLVVNPALVDSPERLAADIFSSTVAGANALEMATIQFKLIDIGGNITTIADFHQMVIGQLGMYVKEENTSDNSEISAQPEEKIQSFGELLAAIDKQMENVLTQHSSVGTKHNMLELATNKLNKANFLNQKMVSETEDTDIAKAYMELSSHETALQASLASGARIMQQTLVDFLR